MTPTEDLWLFGYGSLIWKADFAFEERQPAHVHGWQRRFWQGSHDHRGTPDAPGRVVTLIESAGERCGGVAYRIAGAAAAATLAHLDYREKNGYARHDLPMMLAEGRQVTGLVYVATPDNFAHLGAAPDAEIAAQIARSVGPSGSNREYLNRLHRSLTALGETDDHVRRLYELVSRHAVSS